MKMNVSQNYLLLIDLTIFLLLFFINFGCRFFDIAYPVLSILTIQQDTELCLTTYLV